MTERIERPIYLNKLIEFKDKDIVKIVTGIRRCGRSTLLDLYEDYLLVSGVKNENILRMNMESLKHRDLLEYLAFYDYVSHHIVKGEKNYLIFDELQAVTGWEKAIESFRLDFDVDIYITGSNAFYSQRSFQPCSLVGMLRYAYYHYRLLNS
ncbi:MAG: AAA family ATPase [Longicatena sp.]